MYIEVYLNTLCWGKSGRTSTPDQTFEYLSLPDDHPFCLYKYKGGKHAVIAEMKNNSWSLLYLPQMWTSIRKVGTVVDETGSVQLFWSLLNLRKKEGEVVLKNPLWATMITMRKKTLPVKTISKEICPCSLYLGSEEHQPVQQPLVMWSRSTWGTQVTQQREVSHALGGLQWSQSSLTLRIIVWISEGHSDCCICTLFTLGILCGVSTRLEKEGWLNEDRGTPTTLASTCALQVMPFFTWYDLPSFSCIRCGYGMSINTYTLGIYLVIYHQEELWSSWQ